MDRTRVNIAVGVFLILGIFALGYLSVKLGKVSLFGGGGSGLAAPVNPSVSVPFIQLMSEA